MEILGWAMENGRTNHLMDTQPHLALDAAPKIGAWAKEELAGPQFGGSIASWPKSERYIMMPFLSRDTPHPP